jgi:Threonylcarbamoyl adenosine biosynthesis protein TsaE
MHTPTDGGTAALSLAVGECHARPRSAPHILRPPWRAPAHSRVHPPPIPPHYTHLHTRSSSPPPPTPRRSLGIGKSELARGFVRAWAGNATMPVPSPSFLIAITYDAATALRPPRVPCVHMDLYRLAPGDTEGLGLPHVLHESGCLACAVRAAWWMGVEGVMLRVLRAQMFVSSSGRTGCCRPTFRRTPSPSASRTEEGRTTSWCSWKAWHRTLLLPTTGAGDFSTAAARSRQPSPPSPPSPLHPRRLYPSSSPSCKTRGSGTEDGGVCVGRREIREAVTV